jgi:hypothetical protein
MTLYAGAAAGEPSPQSRPRGRAVADAASGPTTVLALYFSFSTGFTGTPVFAFQLPSGTAPAQTYELELFDATTGDLIAFETAQSVATGTGTFVTFPFTTPIAFTTDQYVAEVVQNSTLSPTATPTAAPTASPTATATPTATASPTAVPTPTSAPTASCTAPPTDPETFSDQPFPGTSGGTVADPNFYGQLDTSTYPSYTYTGTGAISLNYEYSLDDNFDDFPPSDGLAGPPNGSTIIEYAEVTYNVNGTITWPTNGYVTSAGTACNVASYPAGTKFYVKVVSYVPQYGQDYVLAPPAGAPTNSAGDEVMTTGSNGSFSYTASASGPSPQGVRVKFEFYTM